MSRWTHAVCDDCWNRVQPDREPHRFVEDARQIEVCCYCAEFTLSGIYQRQDPSLVGCGGNHGDES